MKRNIEIIDKIIRENYKKMEVKFNLNKKKKYRVRDDSEILKLVITSPNNYTEEYQKIIDKRFNTFDVNKKLSFLKLSDYKYREKICNEASQIADKLYKICVLEENGIENYNSIMSILKDSRCTNICKEKIILIIFSKRCKRDSIYDWTKTLNYVDSYISRSIFRNILNEVAIENKFKVGRDVSTKVDDIKDQIESALDEECAINTEDLKMENQNLRSSLIIINDQLDKYKQDLEKFKEDTHQEVIYEFIQNLNSDKYGRLLDNFIKCEKSLKALKRSKYEFPLEVESIPVLIKQYVKFTHEYGIKEIQRKEELSLSYDEAIKGSYTGTPYENVEDKKYVNVDSPGWIYKDMIISTPIYVEK